MSQALENLLNLIHLEKLDEGLFRGQSEDLGLRQVFGGQVVGQALFAAKQTVPRIGAFTPFTAIFFAPATAKRRLFTMLKVCATAKVLARAASVPSKMVSRSFYMTASFQSPESGFEHQNRCRRLKDRKTWPMSSKWRKKWRICCRKNYAKICR